MGAPSFQNIKAVTISLQSLLDLPHIAEALTLLKDHGVEARIVGGAVRDALMGIPIHDIDIAVGAEPSQVMSILKPHCHVIPTGLNHGTITAVFSKNAFQITSLRTDVETFGRHATVAYGTSFEEDAARRDFTINAMYLDSNGVLYDYFNGQEDLKNGLIRFIGDPLARIQEDYLRILRFFRMYAYFGKTDWHEASLKACKDLAAGMSNLSKERIRHEFFKIIEAPNVLETLDFMATHAVLDVLTFSFDKASLKVYIEGEKKYALEVNVLFRLYAFYWANDLKSLATGFVFTKKERLLWSRIYNLQQQSDIWVAELLYREGMDVARHVLCLLEAISNNSFGEQFKKLQQLKLVDFPLKAEDLQALGLSGKALGDALKSAEKYWYENDFLPQKSDLILFIKHFAE